ncbi:hypothetical protein L1047_01045 [Synechococcus sp. Nb3U1]|uniref:hypothetical protein n=1 Tax=Synechococcus sp. Nb3U1 TaxID=1914529 RepID=UPI001F3A395C|nr:hypothetical protein [Synechococcus sp. Nb3U1]MCF2969782.1 hypothetical protein [Synechococcus sp. Nb3U1]
MPAPVAVLTMLPLPFFESPSDAISTHFHFANLEGLAHRGFGLCNSAESRKTRDYLLQRIILSVDLRKFNEFFARVFLGNFWICNPGGGLIPEKQKVDLFRAPPLS